MIYVNWENGGKSKEEIQSSVLKDKPSNTLELYKNGLKLVDDMIKDIQNTAEIPYRETTSRERNRLLKLKYDLDYTIRTNNSLENSVLSNITYLVNLIDEAENQTLVNLLENGRWQVLRSIMAEKGIYANNWDEDGTALIIDKNTGKTTRDLSFFGDRRITETYVSTVTHKKVDLTTTLNVKGMENEFILDYDDCDDSIKRELDKILKTKRLDAVTVNASKPERGITIRDTEKDKDFLKRQTENHTSYRIAIRVEGDYNNPIIKYKLLGEDTDYTMFNLPTNSIESKSKITVGDENVDVHEGKLSGLPIVKGLRIYDMASYNASSSAKENRRMAKIREETVGEFKIGDADWDISPELKVGWRKYTKEFFEGAEGFKAKIMEKGNEAYNKFIVATENRVREIVNFARESKLELKIFDPVDSDWNIQFRTKNNTETQLVEVWSDGGKNPLSSRENNEFRNIGGDLYSLLSENKSAYKTYLCNSIKSKWYESEGGYTIEKLGLTKSENTTDKGGLSLGGNEWGLGLDGIEFTDDVKNNFLNGLSKLKPLFLDLANKKKDNKFYEGLDIITKAIEEIGYTDVKDVSTARIVSTVISPIVKILQSGITGGDATGHRNSERVPTLVLNILLNRNNGYHGTAFDYSDRDREDSYRKLSEWYGHAGGRAQEERIINQRNANGNRTFEVKDQNLNACLKKIDQLFDLKDDDIQVDDNGEIVHTKKVEMIDMLYQSREKGKLAKKPVANWMSEERNPGGLAGIRRFLHENGIIPDGEEYEWYKPKRKSGTNSMGKTSSRTDIVEEPTHQIRQICENINNNLNERVRQINDIKEPTKEEIKSSRETRLKKLQDKNKAESEEYKILKLYEKEPLLAEEAAKQTIKFRKHMIRYGNISDMIYCSGLASYYLDKGGGSNSEIVNNINGVGLFTLSDENAKIAAELLKEAAIFACTWYVGGAISSVLSIARVCNLFRMANTFANCNKYRKIVSFAGNLARETGTSVGEQVVGNLFNGDNPLNIDWTEVEKNVVWGAIRGSDIYKKLSEGPGKRASKNLSLNRKLLGGKLLGEAIQVGSGEFLKNETLNFVFGEEGEWNDNWVINTVAAVMSHYAKADTPVKKYIINKSTQGAFLYYYDAMSNTICVKDTQTGMKAPLNNDQAFHILLNKNKDLLAKK